MKYYNYENNHKTITEVIEMYSNFKGMDQFISDWELRNYHERVIKQLRPSNVREYELNEMFHQDILENMKAYLIKDIEETLDCYYYELWTATSVMCFRLIERELKTHINCDLEIDDELMSIGECIRNTEARTLRPLGRG